MLIVQSFGGLFVGVEHFLVRANSCIRKAVILEDSAVMFACRMPDRAQNQSKGLRNGQWLISAEREREIRVMRMSIRAH